MLANIFKLPIIVTIFVTIIVFNALTSTAQVSKLNQITNPSLDELQKNFKKPHRNFSTGPLWTWNDRLSDKQVRETLRDLARQNVRQVWVHPRPGLMTPYLSNEWFDRWKTALDEAQKLDMNVWIYDENSYPSGFAGGFVPEAMPDSRGMGLKFEEVAKLDQLDKNIWYVFSPQDNNSINNLPYKNITNESKNAGKLEPLPNNKKYLIGKIQYTPQGGWFGGKWYVDLLKKDVTEKFLDVTLDAYKNIPEIQKEFGNRVPGIFTDEPHPAGSYVGTWVTWNNEIPELFEKRFGYSLIDNLPSLSKTVGDWKKIRHNYHQLILELFVEHWAKPYFERCEKYSLEFTGHYWEHGWPNTSHGPDNMAMYIWSHRPAIDLLMNNYNDNSPNAQFGNVRSVKELASAANQMGRARTLSENYGAGGWDIRFEDLKRLGDWSYALGVNTNNEHLSYVTIKGARKRDHPQSFSYHATWLEGYHTLENYFTRLSYMLSQGRQKNRVVIIEPTTTAWMYQGRPELGKLGQTFTDFVNALERNHVEYDLASEDIINRLGKVEGNSFAIGQAKYDRVIIPPMMENLNQTTLDLLTKFHANRGQIICAGQIPNHIDGKEINKTSDEKNTALLEKLFKNKLNESNKTIDPAAKQFVDSFIKTPFAKWRDDYFILETDETSASSVFFHRRQLDNSNINIVFICNASLTNSAKGHIRIVHDKIEEWDLMTGEIKPLKSGIGFSSGGREHYSYDFELPPAGSVTLVTGKSKEFKNNKDKTTSSSPKTKQTIKQSQKFDSSIINDPIIQYLENQPPKREIPIQPISVTKIRRLDDNVLTLDYVDVKVGADERKDIYTWAANRFVFQKHGMSSGNPWDNQVQFKDELITKKFPENSGFEAVYHFTLQESIPKNLAIVIERPDLYKIYCNEKEVKATPNEWRFDKSFGKIDLSKVAQVGVNSVKIVAQPMTIEHELEPAYLLGDFSLQKFNKGFVVVPPTPLSMKSNESELVLKHNEELEYVSWLSVGVGFRPENPDVQDNSPSLKFEFEQKQKIDVIRIWNYNEKNLKQRGVESLEISGVGAKGDHKEQISLPIGDGSYKEIPFNSAQKFKTITFKILANHNGVKYPIPENVNPKDSGFVGLAEVQFLTKKDNKLVPIKNVTVKASSELTANPHDRKASYLIDGSGFGQTRLSWRDQGLPFYSGKVEYSQIFNVTKIDLKKNYQVQLPKSPTGWYGATAQVVVNGKSAGFVVSSPWLVDVTKFLRRGKNEISVIVYGTPKNLFGPHHSGAMRGQAWPNAFHRAPEHQPSGESYDFIDYGLFKPFTLNSF